jgi:hypothetical protein
LWVAIVASGLLARPPLESEAALLSVAWWQWVGVADAPAANLPVLLIHLGWWVFGVNEWWARLAMPLFGLGALLMIGPTARLLWPGQKRVSGLATIMLFGCGAFIANASLAVGSLAMLFAAVLAIHATALAHRGWRYAGFGLLIAALGLGVATAGLGGFFLATAAVLAPLWRTDRPARWTWWYVATALALAAALAITAPWVEFASADETGRPLIWIPIVLVLLLYPWVLWPALRRSVARRLRRLDEAGPRLCATAALGAAAAILAGGSADGEAVLVLMPSLALIAARVVVAQDPKPRDFHATLPGVPALILGLVLFLLNIIPAAHVDALWQRLAGGDTALPIWFGGSSLFGGFALLGGGFVLAQLAPRDLLARALQVALLPVLLAATLNLEFVVSLRRFFDVEPLAVQIQAAQAEGRPVAVLGDYGGEFDFVGRLRERPTILADAPAALAWSAERHDGVIVTRLQGSLLHLPARPLHIGPAGDDWAALWSSSTVLETGGAVLGRRF